MTPSFQFIAANGPFDLTISPLDAKYKLDIIQNTVNEKNKITRNTGTIKAEHTSLEKSEAALSTAIASLIFLNKHIIAINVKAPNTHKTIAITYRDSLVLNIETA